MSLNFSDKTYAALLASQLAAVPDTLDKREGSLIQTALGPESMALAEAYITMQDIMAQTYVLSATGANLDQRVAEAGIARNAAVAAVRVLTCNAPVAMGARFSTNTEVVGSNYTVTDEITDPVSSPGYYTYKATAETAGTGGNNYAGAMTAITYTPNLTSAVLGDIIIPGTDTETDANLRARYLAKVNLQPFGGNFADYYLAIMALPGVGAVQIYPVWDGGGTVKCSILTTMHLPADSALVDEVQDAIDPTSGQGLGYGLAPIGATVTIVTASQLTIDIETTLTLAGGYTINQVTQPINDAISVYFESIRRGWGTTTSPTSHQYAMYVFIARINAAILDVTGVINVTGTTLNGSASDITLTENATTQQIPILGTITLN